jgi:hypothetical protein
MAAQCKTCGDAERLRLRQEIALTRAYRNGVLTGYNLGLSEDAQALKTLVDAHNRDISEAIRDEASLTTNRE